jgi:site-specific DNA recombinase
MKAIGYTRVSTSDQAMEGVSLDNQRKRIGAYCQYKDFELAELIEDAGISGGINKARGGFISLLDRIEQGDVGVIILYSLERLSRDMLTLLALERLLDEYDVELHTIEGQIDTSTPDGFMSFAMRAFLGEMERRQVKYRTKKAMEHKKANGEVVGTVPFGYLREGKELIRRLVDIVRSLNDQGKRTRTGRLWTPTQVKRLITDYQGCFKKLNTRLSIATRRFIEAIA